jgi:hypothetical protein
LSIRPHEHAIVRNHLKDQVWGNEERYGGNPVVANQSFEIAITAEPSHFRISVNSHPFCTFNYRLPIHLAQFISVDGSCSIQYITTDQPVHSFTPAYPVICPPHMPVPETSYPGQGPNVIYPPAPVIFNKFNFNDF